jgi:hypothetical protein
MIATMRAALCVFAIVATCGWYGAEGAQRSKQTGCESDARQPSRGRADPGCRRAPKTEKSNIEVRYNFYNCSMGFLALYVEVIVDGEQFKFTPSCAFPFSASFTTRRKVRCKIESWMCGAGNLMTAIPMHVTCSDGAIGGGFLQCKGN